MSGPRRPGQARTALVTGVTGQDGGYLADRLLADGLAVHGVTRAGEVPPTHLSPDVVLHEVDLLDDAAVAALLADVAPDELYNLVGVSSVAQSWDEPVLTARVNGEVVARLLQAAWQLPTPVRLLQASSAEVFAGSGVVPQDESTPLAPRSPYGASKAFAHQLVQVYRARGMHAVNVVLYNHESPRRPPTFVTRKITSTVAAIADGRADELVLGSLDARRDWGWAPEYVDGMVRALAHDQAQDWVLATGRAHSVREFVAAAFAHVSIGDWERLVRSDPAFVRPTDAPELVGDAGKAARLLGWTPQVGLAEIVGRMVDADRRDPAVDP